jgi:hypothetical protein
LDGVASAVEGKLREVSNRTLEKLQEMSPDIANTLNPVIPTAASLKWADVFKNVSITSDENIPINKRGSGSKRLILLNFFRAEVERRQSETKVVSRIMRKLVCGSLDRMKSSSNRGVLLSSL